MSATGGFKARTEADLESISQELDILRIDVQALLMTLCEGSKGFDEAFKRNHGVVLDQIRALIKQEGNGKIEETPKSH